MSKRKREHKQAVIAGTEKPYRASPDRPKVGDATELVREFSAADKIAERIRKLKENKED